MQCISKNEQAEKGGEEVGKCQGRIIDKKRSGDFIEYVWYMIDSCNILVCLDIIQDAWYSVDR